MKWNMQGGAGWEYKYCSNDGNAFIPGVGMQFGLVVEGWGREGDADAAQDLVLCAEFVQKPEQFLPA